MAAIRSGKSPSTHPMKLLSAQESKVLSWISSNQEYLIRLLQDLIRIPSIYPSEADAQGFVAKTIGDLCDELDIWEPSSSLLDSHPAYFVKGQSFKNRPNVVGIKKGKKNGRSILLNAHIDV